MGVLVEHVFQRKASFVQVAQDAAVQLEVLFGVDKYFKIKLTIHFREVKDEDAFDNDDGRRAEGKHLRRDRRIVEGVFLSLHGLTAFELLQITGKLRLLNDGPDRRSWSPG